MIVLSILEPDENLCQRLSARLGNNRDIIVKSSYSSSNTALKNIPSDRPDVVLMDISVPCGVPGPDVIKGLKNILPNCRILVYSSLCSDESARSALNSGADGFRLKMRTDEELISDIKDVHNGAFLYDPEIRKLAILHVEKQPSKYHLTKSEIVILKLLAQGKTNLEIATRLFLALGTVKWHNDRIFKKLGVHRRVQAVIMALKWNII